MSAVHPLSRNPMMRETAAPPLGSGHHKLRPSCDRTPVFRDIATITSGFGAVTISPEHHSLIADEPIMTTTAFPTGRPNYRYKKASKEGRNPGLSRPRRPEVTSGRSSSCPTPCRPLPHLLHCPLCGHFSARPPVRFLGSEPRHHLLGAMALPGDPYQDALINASNSLSASAPDRDRGRGSHSGDRLVRDMALLAVGLDAGHALHHRGRGRVRSRFLLPRPRHAGPSPPWTAGLAGSATRGGGSVAAPPEMAGSRPAGPGDGLMNTLLLSGLALTAAVCASLTAAVIPLLRTSPRR